MPKGTPNMPNRGGAGRWGGGLPRGVGNVLSGKPKSVAKAFGGAVAGPAAAAATGPVAKRSSKTTASKTENNAIRAGKSKMNASKGKKK